MKTYTCPNCGRRVDGQREFVLHLLTEAGPRGVHTFALRSLFVGNPSQRIEELEELGHKIRHQRERLRGDATGARYTLISHAVDGAVAGPAPLDEGTSPGGTSGTGHKTTDPWRRVFLCPHCAYREVPSRVCPRGHQAVRSWTADFTQPAAQLALVGAV